VVVWCRRIVDMRSPFASREFRDFCLMTPVDIAHAGVLEPVSPLDQNDVTG
jgi:hypothetical protein